MRKGPILLLVLFCAFSCTQKKALPAEEPEELPSVLEQKLASLSLDEKLWQLITVDTKHLRDTVYPVGGIVLFGPDIKDSVSLKQFTDSLHSLPSEPLISIDEEGGMVARISSNRHFDVPRTRSMAYLKDSSAVYSSAYNIGCYLERFGIDIDFAPVADVNTNPRNVVIGKRAFSKDPEIAAKMVVQYLKGLSDAGVYGCMKHFPGHGDTRSDTHRGYVQTMKSWDEMLECEMLPFKAGIEAGAPLIMAAHISAPKVTGSNDPSSLSAIMLTQKLRKELGYEGVIVTDALRMGAVSKKYSSGEAAVRAVQAGADMLLQPRNPREAHDALMKAVQDSVITRARVDSSLRRILRLKLRDRADSTAIISSL